MLKLLIGLLILSSASFAQKQNKFMYFYHLEQMNIAPPGSVQIELSSGSNEKITEAGSAEIKVHSITQGLLIEKGFHRFGIGMKGSFSSGEIDLNEEQIGETSGADDALLYVHGHMGFVYWNIGAYVPLEESEFDSKEANNSTSSHYKGSLAIMFGQSWGLKYDHTQGYTYESLNTDSDEIIETEAAAVGNLKFYKEFNFSNMFIFGGSYSRISYNYEKADDYSMSGAEVYAVIKFANLDLFAKYQNYKTADDDESSNQNAEVKVTQAGLRIRF